MGTTVRSPASSDSDGDGCSDDPGGPPTHDSAIQIEINLKVSEPDPPLTGWIEDYLKQIACRAGVRGGLVNILIIDDAEMSELHHRYLGDPQTTDVLTFDLGPDETGSWKPGDPIEGDLAVCLDQAAREAADRGHDTRLEVLLYAVHGLLHLIGMDDHTPASAEAMHRREDELLFSVGLGPVFDGRRQNAGVTA